MSVKVMIRNVRLSYEHIFTPSAFQEGDTPKYSADLIIPKDHPQVKELRKALKEAGASEFGAPFEAAGWPKGYSCALKDADVDIDSNGTLLAEKNPEYAGCYILKADSTRRPVVLNRDKSALTEADGVVYSGCYVNVSAAAAAYTYGKVKKGVKFYLNGVQFVKDGERFGSDATADFDELDAPDVEADDDWMSF